METRFPAARAVFDHLASLGYSKVSREHGYENVLDWVRIQCGRWSGQTLSVLDLGCADGQIGSVLVECGVHPVLSGIDFSEPMLEQCRRGGLYRELVHADLNVGLGYEGTAGPFQLVTACGLLEFLEDAEPTLRALRRHVADDGELWATFEAPHPDLTDQAWKFPRTQSEAARLLDVSGWEVRSVEQRVGYQQVAGDAEGRLRSLGIDVLYSLFHAIPRM